jgi:hypothetical protein
MTNSKFFIVISKNHRPSIGGATTNIHVEGYGNVVVCFVRLYVVSQVNVDS